MSDIVKGPRLTRRTALAGALGTAAIAAAGTPALGQVPGRKPNVLFIMADDLGYADLSCYGRRDYETPVLDGLATQGMMFTHAYANSAVCTATRVGLITGRYQYRLPVGLHEPLGAGDVGLPPEHPTIASLMRLAGYRTTLIGKWHMGSLPKFGPLKSGYDEFWGLYGGGVDYFRHGFGGRSDLWDGETRVEETGYVTDLLAERQAILDELREVEEDALAGRITADDRVEARRALGQRLRLVTEALRDLGELSEPANPSSRR